MEWVPGAALLASFMRRTASPASLTCASSAATSAIFCVTHDIHELVSSWENSWRTGNEMVKLYVHYELEEPEFTLPVRVRVPADPRAGALAAAHSPSPRLMLGR